MKYIENKIKTLGSDYDCEFRNYLSGAPFRISALGEELPSGGFMLPNMTEDKYERAIGRESIFRSLATVMNDYDGPSSVVAYDSDDMPEFVPELGSIDVTDIADDFTRYTFDRNKLAVILRATTEFVTDSGFDMDGYLAKRLSRAFAKAEDKAFVTGTGEDEPTGILNDTDGAETGVTAAALTFDNVIDLYFSVDKDYRKNGVWLMNDKTALALRMLKANCGMYLWDHTNDTILGRPVVICNDMPDADSGEKPVAFGDLSYYWIVKRSPMAVKTLNELFSLNGQIGWLAHEFIDGKLVRRDAVKVLKIQAQEA